MTAQAAIFETIPAHASHLFFDPGSAADCRPALQALAAQCDGQAAVLGIGLDVAHALGVQIAGLRGFPELPDARPPIPATQHALWAGRRGDEPGDLLLRGHALQALIASAFKLTQAIASVRHRDGRDLTGYEDGTENSKGEAATEAAVAQGHGAGHDGSSFAAVQQWLHDFATFDAMPRAGLDNCVGRRRDDNGDRRTAKEDLEPEVFVVRRSMPWVAGADAGLVFLVFGKSFDAFEAQLRRMTGHADGISDALFRYTRPLTGAYYRCPPVDGQTIDLSALG